MSKHSKKDSKKSKLITQNDDDDDDDLNLDNLSNYSNRYNWASTSFYKAQLTVKNKYFSSIPSFFCGLSLHGMGEPEQKTVQEFIGEIDLTKHQALTSDQLFSCINILNSKIERYFDFSPQ